MTDFDTRRLAFGDALRRLRLAAGLSGKQLAQRAGWTPSKVSRVETAKQSVSDADVVAYCRLTDAAVGVEAQLRQELREIRIEAASWKRQLRTGNRARQEYGAQLEHDAERIRLFEIALVPGLVQTAEYARYVFEAVADLHQSPPDVAASVAARMSRQAVLFRPGTAVEVLCSEAALRHQVAPPQVMVAQLDRLLALAGMSTLRLAVLPLDAQLTVVPLHGFAIIDDLALVETVNTEMTVTDTDELARFHRLFDALLAAALEGSAARAVLRQLIEHYIDE
ncbi:helix-turn-helix domain-containing protein [Saccharopolyspora sp. K220]|uniref:helix-turn-helix domain-containing protein n=1 Tax=Saccharopolyspora soli TaxID=2926618 RepID=UPI001F59BDE2|nr:helix-turn-helix transcriptional regulator [Saccharopolyspora soli]MCI2423132.1 helix-turn-helix domain-containing protein [Saccharopolyspora soli]